MFQQPRDFSVGAVSPGPSKRLRLGQPDGDGLLASPNPSVLGGASPFMSPAGQVSHLKNARVMRQPASHC